MVEGKSTHPLPLTGSWQSRISYIHTYIHKFSSHVEGFLFAIQEQEIDTRALRKMREKNKDVRATLPMNCRLCVRTEESIFHIISSCSYLSRSLYLHARHNPVAKVVYEELRWELNDSEETTYEAPLQVTKIKEAEIWWDMPISALNKILHNRPDYDYLALRYKGVQDS